MNKAFLDEIWEFVATSVADSGCCDYWAECEIRTEGHSWGWIIKVREHNEGDDPGEWFQLNRRELKKDVKALFDYAAEMYWKNDGEIGWAGYVVSSLAEQDLANWDDEIVDIFVQLSTLGEVVYG